MTRQLIAGNWKMNGLEKSARELAADLAGLIGDGRDNLCEWLVCPPFPLISIVGDALANTAVALGAQDCHSATSGAHTGDTSAELLCDLGCGYVIVGHSERRSDHGESDLDVKAKANAAQAAGLVPIICVGETRGERERGEADEVVGRQVRGSIPDQGAIVIAYEPVWAIGTGLTPSRGDVENMHQTIFNLLTELRGAGGAKEVRILYGGSVKPENAAELLAVPHVDGALIGGASLKAKDFFAIGSAASRRGG